MRVLIVDDNASDRRTVRRAIEQLARRSACGDIEFLEAADGGAALEELRRNRPQVLICDVRMPVIVGGRRVPSGLALMREASRTGVRVIAFTEPGLGWIRPVSGDVALLTKGLDVVRGLRVELRDLLDARGLLAIAPG